MTLARQQTLLHVLKSPAVFWATLLLCLNIGLTILGIMKLSPETLQLNAELARRKSQFAGRSRHHENAVLPETLYLRNKKDLQESFSHIPKHAELPDLIEELFTYAGKLRLTIESISYQPKKLVGHNLVQYGLSFQLEGTYDQIKHMIFYLENSPRIISLHKLQFHQRDSHSTGVVLGLDMETYFEGEAP